MVPVDGQLRPYLLGLAQFQVHAGTGGAQPLESLSGALAAQARADAGGDARVQRIPHADRG